ncbi:MAG: hypothetical protein FJW36_15480 [Acidobacteria bacterium]|nr:hypothetical protein [Acidobacteriota bacterium]
MWRKLLSLFGRPQLDQDISERLEAHFAHKQFHLEQQGLPPEEAAREARLAFGNLTAVRERTRAEWSFPTLESIPQDLAYGARLLRKDLGFTTVVLLTLMIGIGANVAALSRRPNFVQRIHSISTFS